MRLAHGVAYFLLNFPVRSAKMPQIPLLQSGTGGTM